MCGAATQLPAGNEAKVHLKVQGEPLQADGAELGMLGACLASQSCRASCGSMCGAAQLYTINAF